MISLAIYSRYFSSFLNQLFSLPTTQTHTHTYTHTHTLPNTSYNAHRKRLYVANGHITTNAVKI